MKWLRLFTFAACAAALLPRLAHRGMFVDGVTYAAIARNLAAGRGRFWSPAYTATLYPEFHEHPPLGFWLQSWWFRLLGDHLFVERVYTTAVAAATACLIVAIWRSFDVGGPAKAGLHRLGHGREHDDTGEAADTKPKDSGGGRLQPADFEWLPILLWIAVPVVSWSIVGNLLETTVSFFTTAALAASLCAALTDRVSVAWGYGVLSGLCVAGAGLTKGPVGFFPLAAPIVWHAWPGARRAWAPVAAQWIAVALCALVILLWPEARASLEAYLNQQVVPAIAGEREVSAGSLTILKTLLQGVSLPMIGCGFAAVLAAGGLTAPAGEDRRRALCLLAIALAGTLPIVASAKQAGHYLVPAVPAFALAAALTLRPTAGLAAARLAQGRAAASLRTLTVILLTLAAVGCFLPQFGRDRSRLADLDRLAPVLPRGVVAGVCAAANGDWGLHAWFERLFEISLDAREASAHEWFLETSSGGCVPSSCTPFSERAGDLVLMRCRRAD